MTWYLRGTKPSSQLNLDQNMIVVYQIDVKPTSMAWFLVWVERINFAREALISMTAFFNSHRGIGISLMVISCACMETIGTLGTWRELSMANNAITIVTAVYTTQSSIPRYTLKSTLYSSIRTIYFFIHRLTAYIKCARVWPQTLLLIKRHWFDDLFIKTSCLDDDKRNWIHNIFNRQTHWLR